MTVTASVRMNAKRITSSNLTWLRPNKGEYMTFAIGFIFVVLVWTILVQRGRIVSYKTITDRMGKNIDRLHAECVSRLKDKMHVQEMCDAIADRADVLERIVERNGTTPAKLDITLEQERQRERWSQDFDNKHTASDWLSFIGSYLGRAYTLPWNAAKYREALVKTAAICVTAIETLDQNEGRVAPRHFDPTPEGVYEFIVTVPDPRELRTAVGRG
jgi:hypothetical protein